MKKPTPPVVLGINDKPARLRKIVKEGRYKDFEIPEDIALDLLEEWAKYGQAAKKYIQSLEAKAIKQSIKRAKFQTERLNKIRAVDPKSINQPFTI